MKFKLYRYDFPAGTGLGGSFYGPGVEFHLTDENNDIQFTKREGVDDKFWKHTGYPIEIHTEYEVQSFRFFKRKYPTGYKFVRYMDEKELIGQVKDIGVGKDVVINKIEAKNSITSLEVSED